MVKNSFSNVQSNTSDLDKNESIYDKIDSIKKLKTPEIIKDSNFNLDSLAQLWIENDLGMDKEDLKERTKVTRKKFKKINLTKDWDEVLKQDIWETLEGGIVTYYIKNNQLQKIHVRNFGETFQSVQEFYLENDSVFFVFELEYKYNRPMYYDSAMMIENNDSEVWNFDESEIIETRHYFNNGNLVRQISNQDCGAPNSQELRDEENNRLKKLFSLLKDELKKPIDLSPN